MSSAVKEGESSAPTTEQSAPVRLPSPPSTIASEAGGDVVGICSTARQWRPETGQSGPMLLSVDVAKTWFDRNYLFYLTEPSRCMGSRACQRQFARDSMDTMSLECSSGHIHADWYAAVAGIRSTVQAKKARLDDMALSRAEGTEPSICHRRAPRAQRRGFAHYRCVGPQVNATQDKLSSPVDETMEDDDVDSVAKDDNSESSDDDACKMCEGSQPHLCEQDDDMCYRYDSDEESSDADEDEEQWDEGWQEELEAEASLAAESSAMTTLANSKDSQALVYSPRCIGYIPKQWHDFKPVWLRVRQHLAQTLPSILDAHEILFMEKVHWLLHTIYHSICIPANLQSLFLDFLGLAPPHPTTVGCEQCVIVNGEVQCNAAVHSIDRSDHWMVPRELWPTLLLELRAFAGDSVSLVTLGIDGLQDQAIGVGSLSEPASSRFFFSVRLHETLAIVDDDGEDEEEDGVETEQTIESYLTLPSGPDATTRPSYTFSVKWAYAS